MGEEDSNLFNLILFWPFTLLLHGPAGKPKANFGLFNFRNKIWKKDISYIGLGNSYQNRTRQLQDKSVSQTNDMACFITSGRSYFYIDMANTVQELPSLLLNGTYLTDYTEQGS